jgi:hypothetical protein
MQRRFGLEFRAIAMGLACAACVACGGGDPAVQGDEHGTDGARAPVNAPNTPNSSTAPTGPTAPVAGAPSAPNAPHVPTTAPIASGSPSAPAAPAAPLTAACEPELGNWTGTISNGSITIPRLGPNPTPLQGGVDLTFAGGEMSGTLHGTGTLTAMVSGFPVEQPVDFTADCGTNFHVEKELMSMLGKVKLTIDGTLTLGATKTGQAHFTLAGVGMRNMGLTATGDLTLREK